MATKKVTKYLRINEVRKIAGEVTGRKGKDINLPLSTLYYWMQKNTFPKPIKLGPGKNGTVVWNKSDIDEWIKTRKKATYSQ